MKALNIEGVDKVGKHTSVLAATKLLLSSEHNVIFMDLPQYWNLGGLIHKILRKENLGTFSTEREMELRCVMYALDRLTTLPFVSDLIQKNPDSVLISDRGWNSNALALGYGRSQEKIREDDIPGLVKKFPEWDREYLKMLNPVSVVLSVGDNGKSGLQRGEESDDIHEHPDAQMEGIKIFKEHLKLTEVFTQIDGEWRSKIDIAKEILEKAQISFDLNLSQKDLENIKTEDILKDNKFSLIGPGLVYPIIYGKEWESIKVRFESLIADWKRAVIDGNKPDLKIIEPELARLSLEYIPKDIYFDVPQNIKLWMRSTFDEYPEIENVIKELCGVEYWEYISKFSS